PTRPEIIPLVLFCLRSVLSLGVGWALGALGVGLVLLVSVVVAAADITFGAASGAFLKSLVPADRLLTANARFESANWTALVLGPPLGGAAIGLFGPVTTVAANAVSFLLSALGIRAVGGGEPRPAPRDTQRLRAGDLLDGWRYILTSPALRPLFFNSLAGNALIMVAAPPLAVLMLGPLGFTPLQYGLAFAVPCLGGLLGSRLARPLVARYGQWRVLRTASALRAVWPLGLAFIGPGLPGLLLVMFLEFGVITCSAVYSPVYATRRLEHTPDDRVARTLSAWSITGKATTAAMTALWGLLASLNGPRTAIALAGILLLATPLLLLRETATVRPSPATVPPSPDGSRPSR
ncbi:MFS transporter, partial [Streptomyces sp. NPDC059627]